MTCGTGANNIWIMQHGTNCSKLYGLKSLCISTRPPLQHPISIRCRCRVQQSCPCGNHVCLWAATQMQKQLLCSKAIHTCCSSCHLMPILSSGLLLLLCRRSSETKSLGGLGQAKKRCLCCELGLLAAAAAMEMSRSATVGKV